MDSSSVAFEKFDMWKNSRTVLRLTIVTAGEVGEISHGSIFFVDESEEFICFVDNLSYGRLKLPLDDVSFILEVDRVEILRGGEDRFILEEVLIS